MANGLANIALGVGRSARSGGSQKIADIIEFMESNWGLKIQLFPVQRIILKAHYGIELDDKVRFSVAKDWRLQQHYKFTEAEYLQYLFDEGRCNIREVLPGQERRELVLSIGRRSGKTFLSAGIAAYETYKLILKSDPHKYYGISASDDIQITSIATDKRQAGILYREVSGHFRGCDFFSPYTANNTMSYARFQTPRDIEKYGRYSEDQTARASIMVTFQSCIAKGLRGPGNIVIIMDEAAHFTDGGQSSAEAVDQAVRPSTATFSPKDASKNPLGESEGRMITISSPLGRQGHFYKLFQEGFVGGLVGDSMICIQAPTWETNPTVSLTVYEKAYRKDATKFFTEYGGQFTDRTRGWIEREDDLVACIDKVRRPAAAAPSRRPHYIGIDVGLVNDSSAVAIGHLEVVGGMNKIVVDLVDKITAGVGQYEKFDRLEFDTVADWITTLSRKFFLAQGMFDQWAGIPFEQALNKRGFRQLKMEHMTKQLHSDIYKNFKDMMWDKRVVLYDWPPPSDPQDGTHCEYIRELLELQADTQSKYVITVHAPELEGKHDDTSDALVRMVWLASQALGNTKHIAGVHANQKATHAAVAAEADFRRGRLKTLRKGGSSPDRQPARYNHRMISGR